MRLLLPMAYVFLFTLKDDEYANGKPSDTNDNYTYRLLELDVDPGDEEPTQHTQKIRPSHATMDGDRDRDRDRDRNREREKDNSYQQNIVPRVLSAYERGLEDDEDRASKKGYKNVKRRVRNDKKLVNANVEIPDDFREEISQFEIPNRSRRRVKKKKKFKSKSKSKSKSTTPEPDDDIKVEEVEDEDENNSQEEEEEVEEKKEKVHKFTVKKKRPFVNVTKSSSPSPPSLSYETIVDSHRVAGHSHSVPVNNRPQLQSVSPYRVPKIRPLISQENVEALNPNNHGNGGATGTRKGIKPRDVNLILRTRHSPRILIRRYKPLFGAYVGFNLVDRKRAHRRPHKSPRKKPCKKCKKKRKKNKFYHKFPALASDVETLHSHPSTCNQNQHQQQHQHQHQHQPQNHYAPFPISSHFGVGGMSTFPFYADQPSGSVSYQYSPNHNDYYEENLISPRLPSQPVNSYVQMPFENHHYPSETYTTLPLPLPLPFVSTELPYAAKTDDYVPVDQQNMQMPSSDGGAAGGDGGGGGGGYDVHEHENTEELAANHQQETDVNLEDENDALQYDDNEDENAAVVAVTGADGEGEGDGDEYVENEEDESDPRWGSVFDFSKKPVEKTENEVEDDQ